MRLFLNIAAALMIAGPAMAQMVSSAPGIPNPVTSAQLAAALSDETGTGLAVFATSPTFLTSALFPDGGATLPGIAFSGEPGTGLYRPSTATTAFIENGVYAGRITAGTLTLRSSMSLGWTSTSSATNTADTLLVRDAANTLALANDANAQTFNIYNTTDGTNKEYVSLGWSANAFTIGAVAAGTGTCRSINFSLFLQARCAASTSGFIQIGGSTSGVGSVWFNVGGTSTASSGTAIFSEVLPVINQTSTAGYTGIFENATESATGSGAKLLIDLQVGSVSKFSVTDTGIGTFGSTIVSGGSVQVQNVSALNWNGRGQLTSPAAGQIQLGAADAAAPVAQTLSAQSVVAGTTDTAGANLTIQGSRGTGAGAGGSIKFQIAQAGSTGSAQNAFADALTIDGATKSVTLGNSVIAGGSLQAGANSSIFWGGRSGLKSPADGQILLGNAAGTGFGQLQFGGTTSSFPAIKRNGTELDFRLADDSADAPITVSTVQTKPVAVVSLPTCDAGHDGNHAFVTDDLAALAFGAAVTAGGSNHTPVYCDGSGTPAWKIG